MGLFGKQNNRPKATTSTISRSVWPEGAIPYDDPVSSGHTGPAHTMPSTPYEDTPAGHPGGININGKMYYSKHHKRIKQHKAPKPKTEIARELGVYPEGFPEMAHMTKSSVIHPSAPNPADCTCGKQHAKGRIAEPPSGGTNYVGVKSYPTPSQSVPSEKPAFALKGVQAIAHRK